MSDDIKTFIPIVASGISLVGVAFTLLFTIHNARRQLNLQRRDSQFNDIRKVVADLLVSSEDFLRYAHVITNPSSYDKLGAARTSELAHDIEQTMRAFRRDLARSAITIDDSDIRLQCQVLSEAFDRVAEVVHDSIDSFWAARRPSNSEDDRNARFVELQSAIFATQEIVRGALQAK